MSVRGEEREVLYSGECRREQDAERVRGGGGARLIPGNLALFLG